MAEKTKPYKELKKMNRHHSEQARSQISATTIVNKLQANVENECMTGSQVKSAEVLLSKVMPALTAAELSGSIDTNSTATKETMEAVQKLVEESKREQIPSNEVSKERISIQ